MPVNTDIKLEIMRPQKNLLPTYLCDKNKDSVIRKIYEHILLMDKIC